jgi:hypothetical protein
MSRALREYEDRRKYKFPFKEFIYFFILLLLIFVGYKLYLFIYDNPIEENIKIIKCLQKANREEISFSLEDTKTETELNDLLELRNLSKYLNKNDLKYRILKEKDMVSLIIISNYQNKDSVKILNKISNAIEKDKDLDNFYLKNNCTNSSNCFFTIMLNKEKTNIKSYIKNDLTNSPYDYSISKNVEQFISLN